MPTKTVKNPAASATLPVAPHDLPDDGTPVVFTTSFAKQVGSGRAVEDDRMPTEEDFEDAEWEVRKQTADGWEFLERVDSRPFDHDLRDNYGAGKYEIYPIDPRSGKPVKQLRKVRLISAAVGQPGGGGVLPFPRAAEETYNPMPLGGMAAMDEMPAWMRWQMQQAAEERAEQRRRADEAAARQAAFEEKLALREFERQEREERQKEAERKQREAEAQRRDDRMNTLLTAGLGLAQAFLTKPQAAPPQKDVNDVLLRELLDERRNRTPQANGMRDSLELLVVLDKLAESRAARAERSSRDDDDDEDDGMMKTMLTSMLPSILAGKSGGAAPQLPPEMVDGMIEQAFQSPEIIQKIAMRNPTGIAKSFMQALKANPALESAVLNAIEKEGGGDED